MRCLTVLTVLCVLAAGCSDAGTPVTDEGDEAFADIEVGVSATTGAILGVVVDGAVRPVAGATVAIVGQDREETTDEKGRFAFGDVPAGPHFLKVTKPGHRDAQLGVDVVAGQERPALLRILLERLFSQDPYMQTIKHQGFMQCSQAGIVYGSAPCITDFTSLALSPGAAPQLREVLTEERGWEVGLDAGWQTLLWEMTWVPSAQATSAQMGIVASFDRLNRTPSHNFMNVQSGNPLRAQIDLGIDHPTSAPGEPEMIPPEGLPNLYYFCSVRQDPWPVPAVAINQEFELFFSSFFYAPAPEGWSFLNGDEPPF